MGNAMIERIRESYFRLRAFARNPNAFLREVAGTGLLTRSLGDAGLVWLSIAIILFLVTAINLDRIRLANAAMKALIPGQGGPRLDNLLPWSQLLFPVFWFASPLILGSIRHVFLIILGEPDRALEKTQTLTMYAALPLGILTGLSAILTAAFPCAPHPGAGIGACPAILLGSLLIITGFVGEAYVSIKGLRIVYGQNAGRAVLTWLSPLFFIILSAIFLFLLLFIIMLFR